MTVSEPKRPSAAITSSVMTVAEIFLRRVAAQIDERKNRDARPPRRGRARVPDGGRALPPGAAPIGNGSDENHHQPANAERERWQPPRT